MGGGSIDSIIDGIIAREGGYVNHAADRGGPTNYGITQETLSRWRGRAVTAAEVRALTRDEAHNIYEQEYVVEPGFLQIDRMMLRIQLVDCGVHHGTARATRWLQTLLDVKVDGALGPITAAAANRSEGRVLNNALAVHRIRFMGRLAQHDANLCAAGRKSPQKSNALFIGGWVKRATEFIV